jgi:hypothetical protein
LDEVSDDDDDDAADVNMEEDDDAQHRAPPQPVVDASRGRRQDMDDEPPLEGYQRCVLGIACIMARYGMQTVIAQGYMLNIFALSLSLTQHRRYQLQNGLDWTGRLWHCLQGNSNEVGRHSCH